MTYISFNKLWQKEFYNNVSAKDRVQDINLNQLKLKVNDTYKKDEKITTKFEAVIDEDVINKTYLDTKFSKIEGQILSIEKDYNEYKLHNNKQSVEGILIEKAVKAIIQILADKRLFDIYTDSVEILKHSLHIEDNQRRRPDLEE